MLRHTVLHGYALRTFIGTWETMALSLSLVPLAALAAGPPPADTIIKNRGCYSQLINETRGLPTTAADALSAYTR